MMKLLDNQWQELEPFLLGKPSDPGANAKNNRLFIEAVLWIVSNKSSWHHLPCQFGKWSAAYMRFRRWNESDFWRQLTQSKIKDPALLLLLEQIASYGDLYARRVEQRQRRKARKIEYNATISATKCRQAIKPLPLSSDESTLHWVGLVMPE